MKKCIALIFILSGCASYTKMMVAPDGQMQRCAATGFGLIGMVGASNTTDDCVKNFKSAGYLEIEKAGVVGFMVSDSMDILKVQDNSPAKTAGIQPGDKLVSVNGIPVKSPKDSSVMLFGDVGTKVTVKISHNGQDSDHELVRAPFSTVFGSPEPIEQVSSATSFQKRKG